VTTRVHRAALVGTAWLRWPRHRLRKSAVQVRQRADHYNSIGSLKSRSGRLTIPIGPFVTNTLKERKLACPKGPLDLVFPTGSGQALM